MFLGFDLSTQQLKGVVIDEKLNVLHESSVEFDKDLPSYGTTKGVYVDGPEVHSPVAMWFEALDLVLKRLHEHIDLNRIKVISGAGQQHGCVYWLNGASKSLANLNSHDSLKQQLSDNVFPLSPNWQDSSTATQCREMEELVGGPTNMAKITGSKAHWRFSGPQILKFRKQHPEAYAQIERISLVSSCLASLLLGKFAPLDQSDACGMNLWDIRGNEYCTELMQLVGGDNHCGIELKNKLGPVETNSIAELGKIHPYYVEKYGFNENCTIIPFTGDNPATILSLPLVPGQDVLLSLGTSTTVLMATNHYEYSPEFHIFNHPVSMKSYMVMICYKNGSLAREEVRNELNKAYGFADMASWNAFDEVTARRLETLRTLNSTKHVEGAKIGLYYPQREIIPPLGPGVWRFIINADQELEEATESNWKSPEDDVVAIVESQFLDIKNRIVPLLEGVTKPRRVYVVGGASRNDTLVKAIGNILGCDIYRLKTGTSNACAVGAAMKAAFSLLNARNEYDRFVADKWEGTKRLQQTEVKPTDALHEYYEKLAPFVSKAQELLLGRLDPVQ
ncbi:xylulose kinase [Schizosaccharomyces japonicus yFS275]|uniref:Xylulose kinase n=1 Tax=Schizosaccharomyces japonicus (strain yFS275 / FY16936) TaxID=402676 RepID=B6K6E6_SCHJY|nr:xylulose kinase [Schizosaccharomyces japonicus yFS275]EEB09100.1 xylulose kinase [Schizosaccharomyces japonicus yFS275]